MVDNNGAGPRALVTRPRQRAFFVMPDIGQRNIRWVFPSLGTFF